MVMPPLAEEKASTFQNRGCGTVVPDAQWEAQYQQLIAQYQADLATNKTQSTYLSH